jgi:hypothetical protein
MVKRMRGIAGLFLAGVLLAACNGGGGTGATEGEIIGKWIINKSSVKGTYTAKNAAGQDSVRNIDTTYVEAGSTYYVDIKDDKTYTAELPVMQFRLLLLLGPGILGAEKAAAAAPISGTWFMEGNVFKAVSLAGDTTAFETSVNGNSGSFSQKIDMKGETFQALGTITFTGAK